ncbi:fimbria/pilus outer membrane usher protein [Salmonella enterica subsp. enterica]
MIYSTSVPPGQFEIGREQIADLGVGVGVGVLDVSIYEKNGQVQNYTVPYSTPVFLCLYFRWNCFGVKP